MSKIEGLQLSEISRLLEGLADFSLLLDEEMRIISAFGEPSPQSKWQNQMLEDIFELPTPFSNQIATRLKQSPKGQENRVSCLDIKPIHLEKFGIHYRVTGNWAEDDPSDKNPFGPSLQNPEERQKLQAAYLEALVNNIPILLCLWNPYLQTFYFNQHFTKVLGWTKQDLVNKDPMSLFYPDPDYRELVREFMGSKTEGFSDLHTTAKDGSEVDISWANIPMPMDFMLGIGVDIRNRLRDQIALHASKMALARRNQELEGLFQHAPAGLALFDAEPPFRVLSHNEFFQKFQEEPYRSEGLEGVTIPEFLPDAEESGILDIYREVAATGKGRTLYDFPFDGFSRGRTWWNWNLSPIIQEGKTVAFAHMLIETTESVVARENLKAEIAAGQKLKEELNAILKTAPFYIAHLDQDCRYLYANEQYTNTFVSDDRPIVGRHLSEVLGSQSYRSLEPRLKEVLAGNQVEFDITIELDNIGKRHLHARYTPEIDSSGKVRGIVAGISDITKRVIAEQMEREATRLVEFHVRETEKRASLLAESEDRFRIMADGLPLMVWVHDAEGRQEFVNKRFLEFFEITPAELHKDKWSDLVHPEDLDRYKEQFFLCLRERKNFNARVRVRNAGGEWRWLESWGRPRFDKNGTFLGMVGTSADITNEVRQQEELQNTARELEQAKYAAEVSSNAKSQFLAHVSHEIRTPLAAILGYAEILENSITEPSFREPVETILDSGNFLLEMLNDLLDLSKIEAGRLHLHFSAFSPAEIVKDVAKLMKGRAKSKGIDLRTDCSPGLPPLILSDPARLRQILINLVGNAINFTDTGEVRLRASICDVDYLKVEVEDTGIGISEQHKAQLFEPFFQGDHNRKGTGLGLSICHRLAKLLEGSIQVESTLGKGSTFTLRIKATQAAEDFTPDPSHDTNAPFDDNIRLEKHVLVVENDEVIRKLISRILQEAGAVVSEASNGREAIAKYRMGKSYDAIILDLNMPEMDGFQTAEFLRKEQFSGPLIVLTANTTKEGRTRALASGCSAFLTKPIVRHQLIRALLNSCHDPR